MYKINTELELDGRWIAEVPELPGVLAYGISLFHCACWPIGWSMANRCLRLKTYFPSLVDNVTVAINSSLTRARGAPTNWLASRS